MKTAIRLLLPLSVCLLVGAPAFAQETVPVVKAGTNGLSFAVPTGGGTTVGVTHFLDGMSAVKANLGLVLNKPANGDEDNTGGLSLEVDYLKYLRMATLATYLKGGISLAKQPGQDLGDATLGLGGMFGVEYFFTPSFSIAGEMGVFLNLPHRDFITSEGDEDSGRDISLFTGTGLLNANFYF